MEAASGSHGALVLMQRQVCHITMVGDLMQRGSSVPLSASLQVHEDSGSK